MTGLLQAVSTAPADQVLFHAKARAITAGNVRRTADVIAAQLPTQADVALHTASAALFLAGLLAAARARARIVLPAHLQPGYLSEIGAGLLLTDQPCSHAPALALTLQDGRDGDAVAVPPDPELVFFTSGVTGAPKAVRKTFRQLDREALTLSRVWSGHAGQVVATVSHQHIYGMLFRIFWPVMAGRPSDDRAAEYWEQLAGRLAPDTVLVSSPAHLARLPEGKVLAGSAPARVFSSGAPLTREAAEAVTAQLGTCPTEVLGSTETGGIAWREFRDDASLWTPFPGVAIQTDADGLMTVRSEVAGPDPVATGDRIAWDGKGFRLLGRTDRIVKVEGKRVSLARVEDALSCLPAVAAAAVIDLPARKGALGAIVELSTDAQALLRETGAFRLSRRLRTALADTLEPAERPKHFRFMPIPLDAQGKRRQESLRACFEAAGSATPGRILSRDDDKAAIEIALVPELIWFRGHFPGTPVMPGIAQVHLAVQWGESLWNWRPASAQLTRVKFRRILQPGETVVLSLSRDVARGRLKFEFRTGEIVASEGIVGAGV